MNLYPLSSKKLSPWPKVVTLAIFAADSPWEAHYIDYSLVSGILWWIQISSANMKRLNRPNCEWTTTASHRKSRSVTLRTNAAPNLWIAQNRITERAVKYPHSLHDLQVANTVKISPKAGKSVLQRLRRNEELYLGFASNKIEMRSGLSCDVIGSEDDMTLQIVIYIKAQALGWWPMYICTVEDQIMCYYI